jgi:hypothetical protein
MSRIVQHCHEAEIHVQLLVTVEQGRSGLSATKSSSTSWKPAIITTSLITPAVGLPPMRTVAVEMEPLQADAPDFCDAGNYDISLFVVGMGPAVPSNGGCYPAAETRTCALRGSERGMTCSAT